MLLGSDAASGRTERGIAFNCLPRIALGWFSQSGCWLENCEPEDAPTFRDEAIGPWSHAEAGLAKLVLSVRTRLLPRPLWDQGPIDCPKVDGYHPVF